MAEGARGTVAGGNVPPIGIGWLIGLIGLSAKRSWKGCEVGCGKAGGAIAPVLGSDMVLPITGT